MSEAVIVSATRSPIGRAVKGSLAGVRPDDLATQMVRAALDRVPALDPRDIDDLYLGCGQPAGEAGKNLGRVVAVELGYDFLPGLTVNRYCSSSVQSTRMAFHAIRAGEGDAFISAGVETVSRFGRGSADSWPDTENPVFDAARSRTSTAAQGGVIEWRDPRLDNELPDIYIAMGQTAENVALSSNVSRRDMDEFALLSQNRAEQAALDGVWDEEITPVRLADGNKVAADDSPRKGVVLEALESLRPVFRSDGRVTAGNSCPLSDGAAALVVTSDEKAGELGLRPLARIVASASSALSPEIMGLGPVEATKRALARARMSVADLDLVEINEAFAAQVLASQRELGVDIERLNVHGGAIALGHPFGMTGARIITTLINALRRRDAEIGLVTMCVGGGQGMALVIERMS
ncbi:acetyl-CoA C-acetyltransferase [Rhodococcus sp. 27YEA15]|uniref:acetyl-CoA C-acetyltransferase n=1 Tax=Rhodococcus sp. 27YEA15 TaxID=3156259 RepID=UPI003C7EA5CE